MTVAADAVRRVNGPGPLGRLARRSSVIHLLVLLTMIPTVGLPVFSWSFVRDRNDRAASADRVAQGLHEVGQIDRLRSVIANEITVELTQGVIGLLDLPPAALALVPPSIRTASNVSSKATDAALAPIARHGLAWVPGGTASLAKLQADLAAARTATRKGRRRRAGRGIPAGDRSGQSVLRRDRRD